MRTFTTFDLTTGAIHSSVTCLDVDVAANTPSGCSIIDGKFRGDQYYVLDGKATPLQTMTPTVTGLVVTGLPPATTARVEGEVYLIDDGELDFASNLPGPYVIALSAPTYLPTSVTLG